MSSLYKVTKIEGKGLGCVAISDIKKGSLILSEKLQLCVKTEEKEGSSMWIKSLLKSFYQMSKADQHEYMTLHNKFNNIQNFQNSEDIQKIENSKLEIGKIEQDPEKAEKILEICGIYSTNSFEEGFCFKMSRFNHSCQPNASSINVNGQEWSELRAIENIKAGKEINFSYLSKFAGFRNTKYRRQKLLKKWGFFCSCDLCENDVDIDAEAFEAFIQEAEKLFIDRQSALKDGISHGAQYYSLGKCKKEILCYKQLYKVGKDQNIRPHVLFLMLDQGFDAATTGYQFYKTTDLKIDAIIFAKAAEKFGKFLGNDYVSLGNSFSYKQVYQDVIDKAGY
jgi:hypothetical protein